MIRSSGENHHKERSDDQKREGSGRQQLLVQDQIKYNNKATYNLKAWSVKDPRIVRVSRTFGGKDRHSKVRTIRGLRDRRVRLSVSTAIQLYDLQDRLGLNQPSKVVDWLIKAAQHEIDELPPLHFKQEPGDHDHHPFSTTDQSMMSTQIMDPFAFTPSNSCIDHGGYKYSNLITHSTDDDVHIAKQTKLLMEAESKDHFGSYPRFWNLEAAANSRGKQAVEEISHNLQLGNSHVSTHEVPPSLMQHNLINQPQSNSYPSLVINPMSYNPFLSNSLGLQYQTQQQDQSINVVSPSLVSASSSSGTSRFFLYQPINGGSSGSSSSSPNVPMKIINPKLHMGHPRMLRMSSDHHAATTSDHQLMSNTYLSSNTSPSAEAMKHHIYHSHGHYSSQSPNHTS